MKPGWGRNILTGMFALLILFASSLAHGEDTLALTGDTLSDEQMSEARGGFSLPDGRVLYFDMEYLKLNTVINNDPGFGSTAGFVNGIRQSVKIDQDGIKFDMNILQAFNGGDQGAALANPDQINNIMVGNSFTDFFGLANTNLIAGNYNTASIVNIFNIRLGFFNAKDIGGFNPMEFMMR
ncbi:hypothetical protein DESUT3_21430 [Desulfuromonas versatilis]|uniref:PEP-CTERM sorting domain-containing protein n=1 Tax=Desulfuromonas versatilis TaxID=2802975 RepID=A0ABM8HSZ1_9BACT|nr:hypothetical protein [Desulfuromonas versatilis]BCR05074.1 hypothetical protein DESUT3_21430 [Desulfuromonas versatilis]